MHATLIDALNAHVAARGDTVFTRHLVSDGVQELTFRQFSVRAAAFAGHFHAAGAGRGDVVLIFLKASPDVLPAFVGAMMIGGVPSLMPLPSTKQHPSIYWPSHRTLLERIAPRLLLTDREHAAQMDAHALAAPGRTILAIEDLPDVAPPAPEVPVAGDDVALLQHSSGTTSLKKGVALSHAAILRQAESYARRLGATADDGIVSWLPIYHDMGLIACSMVPLVLGQTVTILDPFQWVGRPATLFDAIQRYDGRFVWMPNFAFEHMTRTVPRAYAGDLSKVTFVDCSEPCKTDTFDRFAERFAPIGIRREHLQVCYAMAETVFAISQTVPGTRVGSLSIDRDAMQRDRVARDANGADGALTALSNGTPIDGITVTIRDGDTVLADDRIGEIVVSGGFLFDGYFNDPVTTADRLKDGWYATRDLGFLRDGELYVLGRKDDLLIINGRNLHAHEVEEIVGATPGLKAGRAVAFGVFNAVTGSEELVIVAERDGAAPDDDVGIGRAVRAAVFDRSAIDVKDLALVAPGWLVKTTSGKISRERNKTRYLEGLDAPAADNANDAPSTAIDLADDIRRIIGRTFRCPPARISRTTVATDISGWDSLAHSTLMLEIEQELDIGFEDGELFAFENVGALIDRANALRAAGRTAASRVIAQGEHFSIVAFGEAGDGPDLIVFAGAAEGFGGKNMLDFASTLRGTEAEASRQFFVTDRSMHWFTDSIDEIVDALNTASPGPKILLGNSMGGYGAIAYGSRLHQVQSILAFAPQHRIPRRQSKKTGRRGLEWNLMPAPGIPTCIIYGEIEDDAGKAWMHQFFSDPACHSVFTLANAGHNVVRYLNRRDLLASVLASAFKPAAMRAMVHEIVASVGPSETELRARIEELHPSKLGTTLEYFKQRYPGAEPPIVDEKKWARRAKRRERLSGAADARTGEAGSVESDVANPSEEGPRRRGRAGRGAGGTFGPRHLGAARKRRAPPGDS